MFGAAAMSLSSFCVVSNALRLNSLRFIAKKSKKIKTNIKQKGDKLLLNSRKSCPVFVIEKSLVIPITDQKEFPIPP